MSRWKNETLLRFLVMDHFCLCLSYRLSGKVRNHPRGRMSRWMDCVTTWFSCSRPGMPIHALCKTRGHPVPCFSPHATHIHPSTRCTPASSVTKVAALKSSVVGSSTCTLLATAICISTCSALISRTWPPMVRSASMKCKCSPATPNPCQFSGVRLF